jgi:hypothetical protein
MFQAIQYQFAQQALTRALQQSHQADLYRARQYQEQYQAKQYQVQQQQKRLQPPTWFDLSIQHPEDVLTKIKSLTNNYEFLDPEFARQLESNLRYQNFVTYGYIPVVKNADIVKQIIGRQGYYLKLTTANCEVEFIWYCRETETFMFWGYKKNVIQAMNVIRSRIIKIVEKESQILGTKLHLSLPDFDWENFYKTWKNYDEPTLPALSTLAEPSSSTLPASSSTLPTLPAPSSPSPSPSTLPAPSNQRSNYGFVLGYITPSASPSPPSLSSSSSPFQSNENSEIVLGYITPSPPPQPSVLYMPNALRTSSLNHFKRRPPPLQFRSTRSLSPPCNN